MGLCDQKNTYYSFFLSVTCWRSRTHTTTWLQRWDWTKTSKRTITIRCTTICTMSVVMETATVRQNTKTTCTTSSGMPDIKIKSWFQPWRTSGLTGGGQVYKNPENPDNYCYFQAGHTGEEEVPSEGLLRPNLTETDRIRSNIPLIKIRPNPTSPTKSDKIRPSPTVSYQIRPNPTESDQIRQSPTKSDRITQKSKSDPFWPNATKSDGRIRSE